MDTGPEYVRAVHGALEEASDHNPLAPERAELMQEALVNATMAQTAALVMIAGILADATNNPCFDLESWADVIPAPSLKECKGKQWRRPACAARHTDDCAYADSAPEPKHELLDVGTRVLVSEKRVHPDGTIEYPNPVPGKISGYDTHKTKYRWRQEYGPGNYALHDQWASIDNSVQVHPDDVDRCPNGQTGDECGSGENQCEPCRQAEDAEKESPF